MNIQDWNDKQGAKLYPRNGHHDFYSAGLGWFYLGQCDGVSGKADVYVNHKKQWLSIVTSNEPSEYSSPSYQDLFMYYLKSGKSYEGRCNSLDAIKRLTFMLTESHHTEYYQFIIKKTNTMHFWGE